ncbi:hypothetical protein VA596_43425 [Amycolatopsis sp., V23-08]|uniref:Uncharacterized protein n=1 Tax=Amycolatopsis heterodermiae TaxID=3110235 RepID=A0ABU5RLQ1_9PSEU|nr:hypothetical protein [Amycolatopsis sp., V23-08]MEA5366445.1 hypothetical protein [Amycolatopsis sp., V23-08]
MVTLEVWYDQEPENDYAEGEPAILVSSSGDLDQLIARVQLSAGVVSLDEKQKKTPNCRLLPYNFFGDRGESNPDCRDEKTKWLHHR